MLLLASLVFLSRDGREFAEVDLMPKFRFVSVAVDGEDVGSQDDEDGFP